ncbi:MAG: hypothetical protein EAY75_02830 [Bacteroidetes bacterium]|nr:MAG: hypothetical protein EAY75_02830 [Bacteroidota bacterium]
MKKTLITLAMVGISMAALDATASGKSSSKKTQQTNTTVVLSADAAPVEDNTDQDALAFENMMKSMFERLTLEKSLPVVPNYAVELNQLRTQNQALVEQIEDLRAELDFGTIMTAAFLQIGRAETPVMSKRNRRR